MKTGRHWPVKPTFEDLFRPGATTSRIQNDCGNWRVGVEEAGQSDAMRHFAGVAGGATQQGHLPPLVGRL
jgi:hypothetical protein